MDTKPGDGTRRTLNINLMLSGDQDYAGGVLQVGNATIVPQKGDLYAYPAALPHKVSEVVSGRRFTLVVAIAHTASDELSDGLSGDERVEYWRAADDSFRALTEGALVGEPKVHILWGEQLEAAGRHAHSWIDLMTS